MNILLLLTNFIYFFFNILTQLQDHEKDSRTNLSPLSRDSISKPASSKYSREDISGLDSSPPKRSKLKLTTSQNKSFTDSIAPPRKETFDTAKHSVLRGCIPRYHLACKKASKISDISRPSHIRQRLNRHKESENVDFVVSDNLTTAGNGYHTLHTFVEKRAHAKRAALLTSTSSSKTAKLSQRTASSRLHALDCINDKMVPTIKTETIETPLHTSPLSLPIARQSPALADPHPDKRGGYSDLLIRELSQKGDLQGELIKPPSKSQIFKQSGFGKPDLDHSFTSEASFDHIVIHLFKSDLLSHQDRSSLLDCHPLYHHLFKMIKWSTTVNFLDIQEPIANFSEQKTIDPIRVQHFLAAALHYDFDIPIIIRLLKGNYTGEYRYTSSTLKDFRDAHCDKVIISDVKCNLLTGYPIR